MKYLGVLLIFFSSYYITIKAQTNNFSDLQDNLDTVEVAWIATYNGGTNYEDELTDLAVDQFGNVYVTGGSSSTDTMTMSFDFVTIKYNTSGQSEWINNYNGTGDYYDVSRAITVDTAGNIYVTGESYDSVNYADYVTIKYSSSGDEIWVRRYNGSGNYDDIPRAVVVDDSGNVYVTGYSMQTGTNYDYLTIKYNSAGETMWTAYYNGVGNNVDRANAIAVDNQGNVFVTGESYNYQAGSHYDIATIKYNNTGTQLWDVRYNGTGNNDDNAKDIVIDDSGNAYITGYCTGSGTNYDYVTIKYSPAGNIVWIRTYDALFNGWDQAAAITISRSTGNIYVAGQTNREGYNGDYTTIKYSPSGNEEWIRNYPGQGDTQGHATDITIDNQENVYVTGYIRWPNSIRDFRTVKYDASGDEKWIAVYNGTGIDYNQTVKTAVDNSGNVFVAGTAYISNSYGDYITIKYTQPPVPVELLEFNAAIITNKVNLTWSTATETNNKGFEIDKIYGGNIKWDKIGFVTGAGTTTEPKEYSFIDDEVFPGKTCYRLKQLDFNGSCRYSELIEVDVSSPDKYSIKQNYPNPFNPSTTISYSIPRNGLVTLKVYNILGEETAELVNEEKSAGYYNIDFNGSHLAGGIYIYRIEVTGEGSVPVYTAAKKMILLK